jgi:hypothetical protein
MCGPVHRLQRLAEVVHCMLALFQGRFVLFGEGNTEIQIVPSDKHAVVAIQKLYLISET